MIFLKIIKMFAATEVGATIRFNKGFLSHTQDAGMIIFIIIVVFNKLASLCCERKVCRLDTLSSAYATSSPKLSFGR